MRDASGCDHMKNTPTYRYLQIIRPLKRGGKLPTLLGTVAEGDYKPCRPNTYYV